MSKIKVLWIVTNGLSRNGICVSQLEYYKNINKDLFQIDMVAVHNDTEDMIKEYENYGCTVYRLPDRKRHLFIYVRNLKKLMNDKKYDIVHVHGSSTLMCIELLTAKKCGIKVRIAHSRNTTSSNQKLERIFRKCFDNSYTDAFACGEDAGKWLFNKKDFIVFHNGKDLSKYKYNNSIREDYRKKLGLNNELAIGHVGRFNNQKNHDFLIELFNIYHLKNSNSKLYLIGDGPNFSAVKEKIIDQNLEDFIILLGNISNVEDYLQAMDIMLLPSFFEGLPNVVLEWQAAGLPCIISDTVTKECKVFDETYCLPINEGTDEWIALIEKIRAKNIDRNELSIIGCQGLVDNGFEIKTNTRKLEEMYSNLLNTNRDEVSK